MRRILLIALLCITGVSGHGCDDPKSAKGFRLPDGDIEKGRETFLALQCHSCHSMSGVDLPAPVETGPAQVVLGGEVTRVQTYGELVTSIINPSHKLAKGYRPEEISSEGESLMNNYNEVMTVQQLVDLVAFLQSHYRVRPPEFDYPVYP